MSFTAPSRSRSSPILPLAAMVDIMFLLLVFFMTAAAFRDQDRIIEVSLPGTETDLAGAVAPPIIVTVDADGRTYIADIALELQELHKKLTELAKDYPDQWIDVRGDTKCEHGKIISVLDTIRGAGLQHVRMHTQPIRRASAAN